MGADKSKLVLTGHPYFDKYRDFERVDTGKPMVLVGFVMALLDCSTVESRIPWFHSPPVSFKNYFRMYEVAERLPDVDFVVKLKPHDLIEPIHFFDSPDNVRANKDSWFDWMPQADVVIGDSSTVTLESIFAGIPTIIPKLDEPFVDYFGTAKEIEWEVDTIVSAIEESIEKKGIEGEYNKFLDYYFGYNMDYNATERVIETIERSIDGR